MDALGALIGELAYGLFTGSAMVVGTFTGGFKDPFFVLIVGIVAAVAAFHPRRIAAVAAVLAATAFRVFAAYSNYVRAGLDFSNNLPRVLILSLIAFAIVAIIARLARRIWLRRRAS